MNYRAKLFLFALGAVALRFAVNAGYSALETISRLNAVEAERDQWQRPAEVIQALALKPGDVAVDLGCGWGYFALKLSSEVSRNGRVIAEDIRRLRWPFFGSAQPSEANTMSKSCLASPPILACRRA